MNKRPGTWINMYEEVDRALVRAKQSRFEVFFPEDFAPPRQRPLTEGELLALADAKAAAAERLAAAGLRQRQVEALAATPITVFCTVCGEPHVASKAEAAHWRRCETCVASNRHVGEKKYCRCCGRSVLREEYVESQRVAPTPSPLMTPHFAQSLRKGWATAALCGACLNAKGKR